MFVKVDFQNILNYCLFLHDFYVRWNVEFETVPSIQTILHVSFSASSRYHPAKGRSYKIAPLRYIQLFNTMGDTE